MLQGSIVRPESSRAATLGVCLWNWEFSIPLWYCLFYNVSSNDLYQ